MIYLDTNILIYPIVSTNEKREECILILNKIINKEISACTSCLTWDEFFYSIKKALGREYAIIEGKKLLQIPNLEVLEVNKMTISKAQEIAEAYKLDPRDAIHAASAILNDCKEIISDDPDFDKVKELKRISPEKFSN